MAWHNLKTTTLGRQNQKNFSKPTLVSSSTQPHAILPSSAYSHHLCAFHSAEGSAVLPLLTHHNSHASIRRHTQNSVGLRTGWFHTRSGFLTLTLQCYTVCPTYILAHIVSCHIFIFPLSQSQIHAFSSASSSCVPSPLPLLQNPPQNSLLLVRFPSLISAPALSAPSRAPNYIEDKTKNMKQKM